MKAALYEQNKYVRVEGCVGATGEDIRSCRPYSFKPQPIVPITHYRGLMESNQPMAMSNISFPVADP